MDSLFPGLDELVDGTVRFYQGSAKEMMELDADNPLAAEIRQETAASYFAACKKMVAALEELKGFDERQGGLERGRKAGDGRRGELVDEAAERVFRVLVQREAMRLRCGEEFFEDYEVPGEVRRRLGVQRGKG